MKPLTQRQFAVFAFIASFLEERGYSPSFEEIGNALKLTSSATVHKHVENLAEKKGYLARDRNSSRSLMLTPEAQKFWNKQKKAGWKVCCPKCTHEFEVRA
jgi:repressor LexA